VLRVRRPEKMFVPEKVLLFARSVLEAALIVIVLPALKRVPLMVPSDEVATTEPLPLVARMVLERPVIASELEVAAARVVLPVKLLVPEKVLLLAKSVVEATVTEPPTESVCPLMVPRVPVKRLVPKVEVATSLPVLSKAKREDAVTPVNQTELVAVKSEVDALVKF